MPARADPIVTMRRVTKRFGQLVANHEVDFDLVAGEIHGLLGQNGSGKTTLMTFLYGLHQPDAGEIRLAGQPLVLGGPRDALSRGIAMIPQRFRLVPTLTVAENVALGVEARGRRHRRVLDEVSRRLEELSEQYGLEVDPQTLAGSLSMGERQRAEILRALYHEPRILLMDEPTSVLTPGETERLFEILARMAREEHRAIVLVTHKIREVVDIAHRVTVLREGRRVATVSRPDLTASRLIAAMLGDRTSSSVATGAERPVHPGAVTGRPVLLVRGLSVVPRPGEGLANRELRNVSFTVHQGEILGIAGVEGNGQQELEFVLAGLLRPSSGEVRILTDRRVVAYIPSDVHRWGVIRDFTVAENLLLRELATAPPLAPSPARRASMHALVEGTLRRFNIEPADPMRLLRQLSGGNIQKVVLARELSRRPALIVATQPTMGLDVAAAAFLAAQLRSAASAGAAVVMISADLDELLGLCDRIGVMSYGELAPVRDASEVRAAVPGGPRPDESGPEPSREPTAGLGTIDSQPSPDRTVRAAAEARSWLVRGIRAALHTGVAGAAGLTVGALFLLGLGKSPGAAGRVALETVFAGPAGFVDTLLQAIPLLLIALGYVVSFRARVWTVGGEGQFHLGAVGAAVVALSMPAAISPALGVPLAIAAGITAGMLWAVVPGWLRAYRQVNEVVASLMFNFVGILVMSWLIRTSFRDRQIPLLQTPAFPSAFQLPVLGESRVHLGAVIALALVFLANYLVQQSAFGHRVRAIGASPHASQVAGIDLGRTILVVFLATGALAGLAGAVHVLGVTHRLLTGMSHDFGYTAVPVALLARNNPLALVPAAFFFSALTVAGEAIQVELEIPSDFILVFMGMFVLFILAGETLSRRLERP